MRCLNSSFKNSIGLSRIASFGKNNPQITDVAMIVFFLDQMQWYLRAWLFITPFLVCFICFLFLWHEICQTILYTLYFRHIWDIRRAYILESCLIFQVIPAGLIKKIANKPCLTNTQLKCNPFCLSNRWQKPAAAWKFSASLGHIQKGSDLFP